MKFTLLTLSYLWTTAHYVGGVNLFDWCKGKFEDPYKVRDDEDCSVCCNKEAWG